MKFAKSIWNELLSLEINPDISFVEYIPGDHSYKVKPSYLEIVKKLITSKILATGIAEKIIDVPGKYQLTSLSFQNFLEHNFYSEEIINALLALYQQHAYCYGYVVFNTFSYSTVESLFKNPEKASNHRVQLNDIKK